MVDPLGNGLRKARQAKGLTQAALAQLAGVTRQTLGALEGGQYAPSTSTALQLARALDCRVEDLFWLDAPEGPLTAEVSSLADARSPRMMVAEVHGRWIAYPLSSDPATDWSATADAVGRAGARGRVRLEPLRRRADLVGNLFVVGCDPALGLLSAWVARRACGVRLTWIHGGSARALEGLAAGHAHIAGLHLYDEASGDFNLPFVRRRFGDQRMAVFTLGAWAQGLVVRPGNPLGIRTADDVARPDVRLIDREAGAGARELLDRALRKAGAPRRARKGGPVARGHFAVARAVAMGIADVGVAAEGAAVAHGLDFIPLARERFDLVVPFAATRDPRVAIVLDVLQSAAFHRELAHLGGYDVAQSGRCLAGVA